MSKTIGMRQIRERYQSSSVLSGLLAGDLTALENMSNNVLNGDFCPLFHLLLTGTVLVQ